MAESYHLTTPEHPDPARFETREEAEYVADYVRNNRRGRMGKGRLIEVKVYQSRLKGQPWSVQVTFEGELYECGSTRRKLNPTYYVEKFSMEPRQQLVRDFVQRFAAASRLNPWQDAYVSTPTTCTLIDNKSKTKSVFAAVDGGYNGIKMHLVEQYDIGSEDSDSCPMTGDTYGELT